MTTPQVLQSLQDRQQGNPEAPFIIAETACAHDGDPDKLRRVVRRSAEADPDAIQVEVFSPGHQVTPEHEMYEYIDDLAFSWSTWKTLLEETATLGPKTFVFAYDRPSLEFALEHDIDGIKLSSADISNPEMIKLAARAEVPTTLSTGGCSFQEISLAIDEYSSLSETEPILMHGVQNFPTELDDAWINRIRLLRDAFGLPVGYQDHTDATTELSEVIDLVALGVGAQVLEKHVTCSRSDTKTDYEAALEPDELDRFVKLIRTASSSLGSRWHRSPSSSEREYQKFQKKKVVTTAHVERGESLSRDVVEFLRNAAIEGISPREFESLKGNIVKNDLPPFHTVTKADIKQD